MGAIAHYIEAEGVPTAGISLVRENTVAIRPPRSLWVSFPLGRPFGAPNDVGLQRRVLEALLGLFVRADGPVILEDYPEDAPDMTADEMDGMVCPVALPKPAHDAASFPRSLAHAVAAEMGALAPWHRLAVERNGRSTVGVSGLAIESVVALLDAFAAGKTPPPVAGLSMAQTLRFAAEDLRSWYHEAVSARPGGSATMTALADWFWGETAAGALILSVHPVAAASADPAVQRLAERTLIPRVAQHLLKRL